MILGAGVFFDLLCQEQIKYDTHKFIFQKTQLGWIGCGRIVNKQFATDSNSKIAMLTFNNLENDISVGEKISKFWELEDPLSDNIYTLDVIKCKDHFEKSVIRDIHGRFEVKLPFRNTDVSLGDSGSARCADLNY